jgi:ribosome-associated protein
MQDDEEMQEFDGRPSKSARKRDAAAAQELGTKLIDLKESDLRALDLGEKLLDAILLAKRITARGGLARQRQYIGKLMRDIDTAPIEAALNAKSRATAMDAEKHKRLEAWRLRLLTEGPVALDELMKWCPQGRPQIPAGADQQGHRRKGRFRQPRHRIAGAVPDPARLV